MSNDPDMQLDVILKAYELTSQMVTELITVASAIVVVGIALLKDFPQHVRWVGKMSLALAWIFFSSSIVMGLLSLSGLAGNLATTKANTPPELYSQNIEWSLSAQWHLFTAAIICFLIFGLNVAFGKKKSETEPSKACKNVRQKSILGKMKRIVCSGKMLISKQSDITMSEKSNSNDKQVTQSATQENLPIKRRE